MALASSTTSAGIADKAQLELLRGSASILVEVGPPNPHQPNPTTASWVLPKRLLSTHSTFFAGALSGSFAEAKSATVNLPEDDPAVFETFIQYLYLGHGVFDSLSAPDTVRAWILGDKLGCQAFTDQSLCSLILRHRRGHLVLSAATARLVYTTAPTGSVLCTFVILQLMLESRSNEQKKSAASWAKLTEEDVLFAGDLVTATMDTDLKPLFNAYKSSEWASERDYLMAWCAMGLLTSEVAERGTGRPARVSWDQGDIAIEQDSDHGSTRKALGSPQRRSAKGRNSYVERITNLISHG